MSANPLCECGRATAPGYSVCGACYTAILHDTQRPEKLVTVVPPPPTPAAATPTAPPVTDRQSAADLARPAAAQAPRPQAKAAEQIVSPGASVAVLTAQERSLLGALLILGVDGVKRARPEVTPGDFASDAHRLVYEACLALADRGEGVDLVMVQSELEKMGRLERAGGPAVLSALVDRVPDVENVESYARAVREASDSRRVDLGLTRAKRALAAGAEPQRVVDSLVQLLPLKSQESVDVEGSEPKFPDPLALEAFHGLAGEFIRLVSPHTEADDAALLAHFLVYFGNAVGRGPFFRVGATRHTAAENVAFVGVTGSGRKGTAEHETRRPYLLAEDPWTARITTGLSSGEGLIHAVRDAHEKQEPLREKGHITGYEKVVDDEGVKDKRLCVLESELGRVLRVMERDGNTLSATLREAWDAREVLRTLTKNSPSVATLAHVSIVGHITREELLRYLDRTETANGFGNRFLWIAVTRSKFLPDGGSLRDEDLRPFVSKLRVALAAARDVQEMSRAADARAAWHRVYAALETGRAGLFGAITGRAAAHVLRLSMIYALTDGSAVIRAPHLAAALALWTYSEDSARFVFGDATGDPEADAIYDALRTTPRLSREAIRDLFSRHVPAQRIAAALALLARLGKAHTVKEATAGRPAEYWICGTSRRAVSAESAESPPDTAEAPPLPRLDRFPRKETRT